MLVEIRRRMALKASMKRRVEMNGVDIIEQDFDKRVI